MGTVHGGILCDLAEAAMGFAYVSTLEDGETFTTLELKINFLRRLADSPVGHGQDGSAWTHDRIGRLRYH
jgi:uncharacterized protein (TIGR00369 family)